MDQNNQSVVVRSYKVPLIFVSVVLVLSILLNLILGFFAVDRTIRVNELLGSDDQVNIDSQSESRPDKPETVKTGFEITDIELLVDESGEGYRVEGSYPSIAIDGIQSDVMNAAISDYIEGDLIPPIETAAETAIASEAFGEFDYEIYQHMNGQVVSVVLEGSLYYGGAHPNPFRKTFVFDISQDRTVLIVLEDAFREGVDYLDQLSTISLAELSTDERTADSTFLVDGTAPVDGNYSVWHIDDNELVIYFGAYQIAAYAAGTFEVRIPITELEGFRY